jgi:hypothetical protein
MPVPIPVPALALETYRRIRQMDASCLRAYLDTTYADWEPLGLSRAHVQALVTYARARLACLTHRAHGNQRLAQLYQGQAGHQARTLNRWIAAATTQASPHPPA